MKKSIFFTLVMFGLVAGLASADVVLQADFKGREEGTGGDNDLVTLGGKGQIVQIPGVTAFVSTEDPDLGAGAYLHTDVPADAPGGATEAGVHITPAAPANSLGGMFSTPDGIPSLNGGFDFFYRPGVDIDAQTNDHAMRAIDTDNRDAGGLRIIFLSQQGSLRLDIDGPEKSIDGTSNFQGQFTMKGKTIYHLGVTFSTDPKTGLVTVKIFGNEGIDAIDTTKDTSLVALSTFKLDKNLVKHGFVEGPFDFGAIYRDNCPKQQDFGRLRIYNSAPAQFDALSAAPTTNPAGATTRPAGN